jgi:hypothetical protein
MEQSAFPDVKPHQTHQPAVRWHGKCPIFDSKGGIRMLLLILLILLVLAAAPAWPYSRGWGYYPSSGLGTVLVILIVLMLLGYVHL